MFIRKFFEINLKKIKLIDKFEIYFFAIGVLVYLSLLYLIQVQELNLIILMLIMAPFSILGMISEIFKSELLNLLIIGVISVFQGFLYVKIFRFLKKN